jgi:hypothetical protein
MNKVGVHGNSVFRSGSWMRKAVVKLTMWWLAPPNPNSVGSHTLKQTVFRGLKTYVALAAVILYLAWDEVPIYCVWLVLACAHGVYQYRYAFVGTISRPAQYEEITGMFLALDIVNHVAVAGFSRVGWWALAPVAFAWLSLGRTVGTLALIREMRQLFLLVREECHTEPVKRQAEITRQLLEERLEMLRE